MDNKLLLARAITLLYRESQLSGVREKSAPLVRELISGIKLPEVNLGINHEQEIITSLKNTALSMCATPNDHQFELIETLQVVKVNTGEDTELYEAIRAGIETELDEQALRRMCLNIRKTLQNHFHEQKVNEIIAKASYKVKFERDSITDMTSFVAEVCSQLEPYQVNTERKDPAVISSVNMANLAAVAQVFKDVQNAADGTTILRTGWQGVNRMLDGGIRRGEEWVFGALQHNYKTGTSLSIFMDIALFNVPVLTDPNKKPLLLRISFEDPLILNFQFMYERLRAMEGLPADSSGMSVEEIASYVQEKLSVNGYHTEFMHVNPSMWTYRDVCNRVLELEAEGFEVHLCMVDYLLKLPTTGCDGKAAGEDIRNMFERIANFMKARNIAFATPHQLSTDAKMMIRDGRQDFVKQLIGRGYYAGCKQLDQVVDGELFMHIEKVNGKSYLTIQRGKHRKIGQTPEEFLYLVLEFGPHGILPDINGPDTSRKKVGGGVLGSGEETPFWDLAEQL